MWAVATASITLVKIKSAVKTTTTVCDRHVVLRVTGVRARRVVTRNGEILLEEMENPVKAVTDAGLAWQKKKH